MSCRSRSRRWTRAAAWSSSARCSTRSWNRHDYPEPVARLLAEAMALTVLLGTSLKFEGKFILQTRSDGPVEMLVADFATPRSLRAYASFDAERVAEAEAEGRATPAELLGAGVLALTVDQGRHMQRYQGIVQLDGTSLEEAARTYFRQSEQIADRGAAGGRAPDRAGRRGARALARRRAGGPVPAGGAGTHAPARPAGRRRRRGATARPDRRCLARGARASRHDRKPDELLDPTVGAERLLYRLFHERGVRVFEGARCSTSAPARAIASSHPRRFFDEEEIAESIEEGRIRVSCEFCSTEYLFDPADFPAGG
jgi:molecular chaperone Hsp33